MWHYQAPLRDMQFIFEHWLQAPRAWSQMSAFQALDLPLAIQVLEDAGRFSSGVLAPLNSSGDQQGCRFEDGRVSTPRRFCRGLPDICRRRLAGAGR